MRAASKRCDPHDNAIALFSLLAGFDEASHLRGPGRNLQHRMRNARGVQGGEAKSARYCCNAQRDRKSDRPPPRNERNSDDGNRQRHCSPPGRLAVGGEIESDAGAEGNR